VKADLVVRIEGKKPDQISLGRVTATRWEGDDELFVYFSAGVDVWFSGAYAKRMGEWLEEDAECSSD
jgi:hypothetical protein